MRAARDADGAVEKAAFDMRRFPDRDGGRKNPPHKLSRDDDFARDDVALDMAGGRDNQPDRRDTPDNRTADGELTFGFDDAADFQVLFEIGGRKLNLAARGRKSGFWPARQGEHRRSRLRSSPRRPL